MNKCARARGHTAYYAPSAFDGSIGEKNLAATTALASDVMRSAIVR